MLDIIKELVPLFEGAKDGAVWLIAAYFVIIAGKTIIIAGVIVYLAKLVVTAILKANSPEASINNWNMYQWDSSEKGHIVNAHFTTPSFRALLGEIAGPSGYVSPSDIKNAAKIIREAKAND